MKSRILIFLLALAAIPACFGASPDKKPSAEGEATILDHAEYSCSNCFFGTSDQFYCFKVGDRILIGHQHVPTMNYRDGDKNYFTKYHKTWTPWKSTGDTVHVKYNEKYIWLPSNVPDKKDVRLEQKYTTDIFMNSNACRDMIHVPAEAPRKN